MPQSGDSDLWPTNDDDNPRKSPSEPVKDAVTHQLPVPDQREKPATSGWFDPPKADEPAPGRDESHAKPTQQRTQPVSWPVADLEKQAKNQSQAATSFARPVPPASRPADEATAFFSSPKPPGASPAWPNGRDTSKGKEFTQSGQPENGNPKPADRKDEATAKPQPDPSPVEQSSAEEKPESRGWFAPAAPEKPDGGANREAEHSTAAEPEVSRPPDRPHATVPENLTKGDSTVNLFQPAQLDTEEPAKSAVEPADGPQAATPPEDEDTPAARDETTPSPEAAAGDPANPPQEEAEEPADRDEATSPEGADKSAPEGADGGSSDGDEPADKDRAATSPETKQADSTVSIVQPSQREAEEPTAQAPKSPETEQAEGDSSVNLFSPPQADQAPKAPEDTAKSGNAANPFPPQPEPAEQTPKSPEGDKPAEGDSTVYLPVPKQDTAEPTPPKSADTKSGNATNLSQPQRESADHTSKSSEGDRSVKGGNAANLFPPGQRESADQAPKSSEGDKPAKGGNATNLSQPQRESADHTSKPSEGDQPVKGANAANLFPPGQRESAEQAPKPSEGGKSVKGANAANLFPPAQRESAEQAPKSSEGGKSVKSGNAANLFPPPQRESAEQAPKSSEGGKPAKGSNATNLSPAQRESVEQASKPSEGDRSVKGGNAANLFPPPQRESAEQASKSSEGGKPVKGGNATNLFPPPQRETGEPADRTQKSPEGADSKTVFLRPVQPPRPPVADTPPAFIRPRQSPAPPSTDPATVHIPRADLQKAQKEWPPPEPPRAAPQRVGPPPEEPPAPRKKKPLLVAAIAIVAVLAVATGVVLGVPGVAEKLGLSSEDVAIAPPPSPVSYTPGLRGPDANAPAPSERGVASALAGPMSNPALGNVTGVVIDPATGQTLYERGGDTPITPASTGKLLTAAAALLSLDHTQQLVTKVVQGEQPGEVIIVGGGDPTINSLEPGEESMYPGAPYLSDLVDQVKRGGVQITTVYIDQSRYADPTMAPSWDPADIAAGYIAPIVPAMLDGDRQEPTTNYSPRTPNPGGKLVDTFAARLGATAPENAAKKAPANAKVLAEIRSAPMSQLVDTMLNHSDNTLGDIIAHEVAIKAGEEPSFAGASKAMLDVLRANNFDVDGVVLNDGSGMSTANKMSAKLLAQVLAVAAAPDGKDPRTAKLRPLLAGLPVAGGGGTLADRYDEGTATEGRGWVRAKTGSLTGINSLAGIVLDKDNRPLVFAFLTTGTTATTARPALDTVSAALRGCGCQ